MTTKLLLLGVWLIGIIVSVIFWGLVTYAAIHFIHKFW